LETEETNAVDIVPAIITMGISGKILPWKRALKGFALFNTSLLQNHRMHGGLRAEYYLFVTLQPRPKPFSTLAKQFDSSSETC